MGDTWLMAPLVIFTAAMIGHEIRKNTDKAINAQAEKIDVLFAKLQRMHDNNPEERKKTDS
jgi:hypothetical protein